MKKYPRELMVLLGRVRDRTIREDFGVGQKELDDLRLLLGIPEPSSKRIDSLTFAKFWQKASSLGEVALEFGMTRVLASTRASILRKHKIPLKEFATASDDFWNAIRRAVKESNGKEETPDK